MVQFKRLEKTHLEMLLHWRTDPEVTRYMATDIDNDLEKQYQWFERVSADPLSKYWVIHYRNVPVGVIGIVNINWQHRYTSWTYYIGDIEFRAEIGGYAPPFFYNYVFDF